MSEPRLLPDRALDLARQLLEIASQDDLSPDAWQPTVGNLETLVLTDYDLRGRRSARTVQSNFRRIRSTLGDGSVTQEAISSYFATRSGVSAVSKSRELAYLKRGMNLARRQQLIRQVPVFPQLVPSRIRQGFVDEKQFARILAELPDYFQGPAVFAFRTGWRSREVLDLTWADVDRSACIVRLSAERSKNGRPRLFPYGSIRDVVDVMDRRWSRRRGPYVFQRKGQVIRAYAGPRGSWTRACARAGHPGILFHDLRRSAARAMLLAGVPQLLAQRLMGHETPAMFQRYAITNEGDLRDAAKLIGRVQFGADLQEDQEHGR